MATDDAIEAGELGELHQVGEGVGTPRAAPGAAGAGLGGHRDEHGVLRGGNGPAQGLLMLPGVDAATGATFAPQRGRGGRPKGARNIRNERAAVEYTSRYGDPLEADIAIGTMALGELITELRMIACDRGMKLGMTIGDVVRWQRECRAQALPYIHAKRAPVSQTGEAVTPMVVFGRFEDVRQAAAARSIEDAIEGEIVGQDQGLSEGATDKSQT